MRYLNVIHIPLARGKKPGTIRIPDLWLADIRPHVRALGSDGRLIIASPLVDDLAGKNVGFSEVEVNPGDEGFEHVALPFFNSMKGYLKVRRDVEKRLEKAVEDCTILHAGYGGHPIPVGQIAWPIARRLNKKRIWIFDGADPFPRMELNASNDPNPLKRWLKRRHYKKFTGFCRQAMTEADLVFVHNEAVVTRFKDVWNGHCHQFDRTFVDDEMLTAPDILQLREQELLDMSRPLRLVAAGRQLKIKGTDHVLRAMKIARDRSITLHLDVYGDGDDLLDFKALASELSLTDRVSFKGTVPYGPILFAELLKSQVMLITNLTAEISRNVMISMALGLPLIIYRNPGTDKLIESHDAGILVDKGNIESLATSLIAAHQDRGRLVQLSRNARALAESNTLRACHEKRMRLVRELLGK